MPKSKDEGKIFSLAIFFFIKKDAESKGGGIVTKDFGNVPFFLIDNY